MGASEEKGRRGMRGIEIDREGGGERAGPFAICRCPELGAMTSWCKLIMTVTPSEAASGPSMDGLELQQL